MYFVVQSQSKSNLLTAQKYGNYICTCSYLSACTCVPGTEWVAGIISRYMLFRRFFYLTCPGSLHAMG